MNSLLVRNSANSGFSFGEVDEDKNKVDGVKRRHLFLGDKGLD